MATTLGNSLLSAVSPFLSSQNSGNNLFKYLNPTTDFTRSTVNSGGGFSGFPPSSGGGTPSAGGGNLPGNPPGTPPGTTGGGGTPPGTTGGGGTPPGTTGGGGTPPVNTGGGNLPGTPPVNTGGGGAPLPTSPGGLTNGPQQANWYGMMTGWYNNFRATNGRAPTQDEWVNQFSNYTGISKDTGNYVYRKAVDYANKNGKLADFDQLNNWIAEGNVQTPANATAYQKYLYSWQVPMVDWYNDFSKKNGRPPTQDEWTKQFQDTIDPTGIMAIDPEISTALYQWGKQYSAARPGRYGAPSAGSGQDIANELNQLLQQYQSQVPFAYKTGESLPYQISPAVWDSLGAGGQQLVFSALRAMGQDPNAWLAQLNAARPVGTIPKLLETVYRQPPTGRSQFTGQAGAY